MYELYNERNRTKGRKIEEKEFMSVRDEGAEMSKI
jgi:hypothetical protein